jgi:anti-sigma B factor antagonist
MNVPTAMDVLRDGDWVVAGWHGEIDVANAETIEQQTLGEVRNTDAGLVIDLTEVSYIDSAGIHSLVAIRRLLANRQQRLAMVVPERSVLNKALEVGGLPAVIPVYRSVPAARNAR